MGRFWLDLRYGIRMLRNNPGFTAVAVLTMALGIGANTAIFSVVNALLLRPLPVKDSAQLVALTEQHELNSAVSYFSYPDLVDYREQAEAFSDVLAYDLTLSGVSADRRAERAISSYVTSNYFTMLGVEPAVGRLIQPSDGEKHDANPVVVLGYSFWQRKFGGDPGVVGKNVLVDGNPVTVIGVTPERFKGTYAVMEMEVYLPLGLRVDRGEKSADFTTARNRYNLRVLARMKPGVRLSQAQASLDVVSGRLARQYPDVHKGLKVRAYPERLARPEPDPTNSISSVAALFLALAGMVLLVACVNVANILLVRATARGREMAIRAALGASRKRLVAQLLTESVLLAMAGGIGGVLLGLWGSNRLASLREYVDFPLTMNFGMDWRVFAYSFGAAVLTGVIVGLVPAVRASRANISAVLHDGGRSVTGGARRHYVRDVLVVAQLAGSVMLLIVAGLLVRSLHQAQHLDLGFDPDHVLNVSMDPVEVGYDAVRAKTLLGEIEIRVRALPGVESASLATTVPLGFVHEYDKVSMAGHAPVEGQEPPQIAFNSVDPPYFATMRIPILRGRGFTDTDNETAPAVALVNEAMAKQFWPQEDPIGKRFILAKSSDKPVEVVGVARDGRYLDPVDVPAPFFFLPVAQHYVSYRTLQVRTNVPPEMLLGAVEQQIRALDSNLPIFDARTMRQSLNGLNGYFFFQVGAGLAVLLGLLGLTLAVVGVYGVVSYASGQRTHEIGIRVAMGAQPRDILKMILRHGVGVVGIGVLVGSLAAAVLTRAIASMLVGISPTDPLTFGLVTVLLGGVALTACYIPARRATRVDPLVALRYE